MSMVWPSGVAFERRNSCHERGNGLIGAGAVIDDDLRPETLAETLADGAREQIGGPARHHAHEKTDRLAGILRLRAR